MNEGSRRVPQKASEEEKRQELRNRLYNMGIKCHELSPSENQTDDSFDYFNSEGEKMGTVGIHYKRTNYSGEIDGPVSVIISIKADRTQYVLEVTDGSSEIAFRVDDKEFSLSTISDLGKLVSNIEDSFKRKLDARQAELAAEEAEKARVVREKMKGIL